MIRRIVAVWLVVLVSTVLLGGKCDPNAIACPSGEIIYACDVSNVGVENVVPIPSVAGARFPYECGLTLCGVSNIDAAQRVASIPEIPLAQGYTWAGVICNPVPGVGGRWDKLADAHEAATLVYLSWGGQCVPNAIPKKDAGAGGAPTSKDGGSNCANLREPCLQPSPTPDLVCCPGLFCDSVTDLCCVDTGQYCNTNDDCCTDSECNVLPSPVIAYSTCCISEGFLCSLSTNVECCPNTTCKATNTSQVFGTCQP